MSASIRTALVCLAIAFGVSLAVEAQAAPPWETRDQLICRAKSGVGFSYWWGGACWCQSGCSPNFGCNKGGCSGNCPSCNHWGGHGADCSGFTSKVWQVPSGSAVSSCGHGPYVAKSYTSSGPHWDKISRSSLQKADALASSTHVMIWESGDPWGSMWTYECKGCSYGCVHNIRTASSSYSAARRHNLGGGECSPGQSQGQPCGKCGTQSRSCKSDGTWGGWSGCNGQGTCSPGEWQEQGCGQCGHQGRSCGGNCQWGGWGSCQDQGPCAPGQGETAACGDCGTHSRSCGGNCQWGGWDGCQGPDPEGGTVVCDTGELGVCADGRVRCVEGWKKCKRLQDPSDELCDDLDNDCDGPADEGQPAVLGQTPPAWAADVLEASFPGALPPGGSGDAWIIARNVGTATWKKGGVWLGASGDDGGASALAPLGAWPAWDVAAVLDRDVPAGELARFVFPVHAGADASGSIAGHLRLLGPGASEVRCPRPDFDIEIAVIPDWLAPFVPAGGAPSAGGGAAAGGSGSGGGKGTGAGAAGGASAGGAASSGGGFESGASGKTSGPLSVAEGQGGGCSAGGGSTGSTGATTGAWLLGALAVLALGRRRSSRAHGGRGA